VENVSKDIGVSIGEFSKIIIGQKKNYFEHLPQMLHYFGIYFHNLVKQDSAIIKNISRQVSRQVSGKTASGEQDKASHSLIVFCRCKKSLS